MRLRFERAALCALRAARRDAHHRAIIQFPHLLAQLLETQLPVPVLAARLAAGDRQARRQMPEPDGAFRLVDVLASGAA